MAKHVILYIYNSFADPIVQGSVLTYIARYKQVLNGKATFSLVTFEQKEYKISKVEINKQKEQLSKIDITWFPLQYHSGGIFILFKKLYDILNGLILLIKLNKKTKIDLIYTVGTIGGAMGYFLAKFINSQLLVHTFEPHSEFMVDFKIWNKSSLSFKLLHKMEAKLAQKADYLLTGTDAMIKKIEKVRGNKIGVFKNPSCVDLDKFKPMPKAEIKLRNELNLNNKLVLLYLGKFGGIYFTKEPFVYFKSFLNYFKEKNPHILIISPNNPQWIISELDKSGITNNFTTLSKIPFSAIQNYINIGDVGYCGIPPLPSQQYRSPIKNGEYLACGIPYIVYKGVSEDDSIAKEHNVGVVLKNNSNESISQSLVELDELMLENKNSVVKRCRNAAIKYRGINQTDDFYKLVLN